MTTTAERAAEWDAEFAELSPFLGALGWADTVRELGWIPDMLDEVVADMRVFFRIDDPMSLSAADFFERARFLPRYQGAVGALFAHYDAERREAEQGEQRPTSTTPPRRGSQQVVRTGDDAMRELTGSGWAERGEA